MRPCSLSFLTAFCTSLVSAVGSTGGNRLGGGSCPGSSNNSAESADARRDAAELLLVHSPFTPYWKFNLHDRSTQNDAETCWAIADCLFEAAGESRKQQFSATALVMGLIPPTIKDIAWPERRLISVTQVLPWHVEMLVLALGLFPHATHNAQTTWDKDRASKVLAYYGWGMRRSKQRLCIPACGLALMLCYGGLAAMEMFSKRSSLGCVMPVFILAWHVVALLPARIHLLFSRLKEKRAQGQSQVDPQVPTQHSHSHSQSHDDDDDDDDAQSPVLHPTQPEPVSSAIPGATEYWPVQMAWAIYYIAGTLIFTSIMAVTVAELVVWVLLGLATAACSKILASFLCLVYESADGVDKGMG